MKKIYFELYDTTRAPEDWESSLFSTINTNNDILGIAKDFAERNHTDIKDIRMYIYESKTIWEKAFQHWLKYTNWDLPDYDSI